MTYPVSPQATFLKVLPQGHWIFCPELPPTPDVFLGPILRALICSSSAQCSSCFSVCPGAQLASIPEAAHNGNDNCMIRSLRRCHCGHPQAVGTMSACSQTRGRTVLCLISYCSISPCSVGLLLGKIVRRIRLPQSSSFTDEYELFLIIPSALGFCESHGRIVGRLSAVETVHRSLVCSARHTSAA